MLRLKVLGSPVVEEDGRRKDGAAAHRKSLALLALLAAAGEAGLSRDKIVAYLWPEVDAERASHRLRQLLHALRRELGAEELFLGSGDLRLNALAIRTDVEEFELALAAGDLRAAVAACSGPFLDGFHLGGAPGFERWADVERARRSRRLAEALETLAQEALGRADARGAADWWARLARLDPLDSRVALRYMQALVAAGSRAEALRVARLHEELLRRELDAAPEPAISELAARLRGAAEEASGESVGAGLPAPPTAIVGRARSLAALRALLLDDEIRLVTLTGPAGTGKTRLALECARQLAPSFPDGTRFVSLAPVSDPDRLPGAIAAAVGVRETAGQPVAQGLEAALQSKRVLLVLDNLEQLVAGAAVVAGLLEACSGLKVLATSRSLLRLRGERAFPVPPLSVPRPERPASVERLLRFGAVRLFVDRARAVQPSSA